MTLATSAPTADWVTAWATVGAAAGTAFTLIVAVFTLRLQVRASLRQQAARIVVDTERHQATASLVVRNMSDLPVTDLDGVAYFKRSVLAESIEGYGIFRKKRGLVPQESFLAPGSETRIPLPRQAASLELGASIMFRDSSGLTWARQWPSGELRLRRRGARRAFVAAILWNVICLAWAVFNLIEIIQHGPGSKYTFFLVISLVGYFFSWTQIFDSTRTGFKKRIDELQRDSNGSHENEEDAELDSSSKNPIDG